MPRIKEGENKEYDLAFEITINYQNYCKICRGKTKVWHADPYGVKYMDECPECFGTGIRGFNE